MQGGGGAKEFQPAEEGDAPNASLMHRLSDCV
jgi:hypothetical protein